jgi:hypothetical protein
MSARPITTTREKWATSSPRRRTRRYPQADRCSPRSWPAVTFRTRASLRRLPELAPSVPCGGVEAPC